MRKINFGDGTISKYHFCLILLSISYGVALLGPPRKLTLKISCDPKRPCISAYWLPPTFLSSEEKEESDKLIAYRIRYRLVDSSNLNSNEQIPDEKTDALPWSRTTEKNVSRLYFQTTAGEHLFGVQYEVSVAAVTDTGVGSELSKTIFIPEAAPSDAPIQFAILDGGQASIHIKWRPPLLQYRNGRMTHYQVRCYIGGEEESSEKLYITKEPQIILRDLIPTNHVCLVRAWTNAGPGPWSNRINFRMHAPKTDMAKPPSNVQCFRSHADTINCEWEDSNLHGLAFYIVRYRGMPVHDKLMDDAHDWLVQKTQNGMNSIQLVNTYASLRYAIQVIPVNRNEVEGPAAPLIIVEPFRPTISGHNHSASSNKDWPSVQPKIALRNPELFAVRNLKCVPRGPYTILIDWYPPSEHRYLSEYEIIYEGRKEYFTASGLLKTVYLGKWDFHTKPMGDRSNMWAFNSLPGSNSEADSPKQMLSVEDLDPNSVYEFHIRPLYEVPAKTIDNNPEKRNGVAITVICQTEWTKPEKIVAPEIGQIYPTTPGSSNGATLVELWLHRTSEMNGPIHTYNVIVDTTNEQFEEHEESVAQLLKKTSQQFRQPGCYLAISTSTSDLFKPNKPSALVMLGSGDVEPVNGETKLVRNGTFIGASNWILLDSTEINRNLVTTNRPIDPSWTYRVAMVVCSQYPDAQHICYSSPWSEPINFQQLTIDQSVVNFHGSMTMLGYPSNLTIIIISLACGLTFFAILSVILGCIVRHRKRQQTGRHILGSANQWDAKICEDLNKSMMAEELQHKMKCSDSTGLFMMPSSHSYMFNCTSSGLHSPSQSSIGLTNIFKTIYPHNATTNPLVPVHQMHHGNSGMWSETDIGPSIDLNSTPNSPSRSMKSFHKINAIHENSGVMSNLRADTNQGHLPIPVCQFIDFVWHSIRNQPNRLLHEFSMIEQDKRQTHQFSSLALMASNILKNRDPKIVPFNSNSVVLNSFHSLGSEPEYINASYIDGYRKSNAYIVTQTPLPETIATFWIMVWSQNCNVLVCLTQCDKLASDHYWPISGSCKYGSINLTHLETMESAYYTVRTFLIRSIGTMEQRTITLFHFTAWPKGGVPVYANTFLGFIRRTGTMVKSDGGPVIVYDLLGTGKAGLYIAVDILLEQTKHEQCLDIFGLAHKLCSQRKTLISSADEYRFIYQCVMECLLDGNTEIMARNVAIHVKNLTTLHNSNNMENARIKHVGNKWIDPSSIGREMEQQSGFKLEFRKLLSVTNGDSMQEKFSPKMSLKNPNPLIRYAVANLSVNQEKNRIPSIVPFDWNRVSLPLIRGMDGSDYINASFIDSYRQQRAYIACQAPLTTTVEDFWRMVWEQNIHIIVMMCALKEDGKERSCKYWPSDKPARYQYFVIDPIGEYTTSGHVVREFKITDARDGESRTVHHLQYLHWPEHGLPAHGESLISLIGHVHRLEEQINSNGPIVVHCSSGSGRTGVFIAVCNVLERLRQESIVDMYQTVKLLRQQRVWMVQTEEQYRFCYLVALEYLSSFDLCTQPCQLAGVDVGLKAHMNYGEWECSDFGQKLVNG